MGLSRRVRSLSVKFLLEDGQRSQLCCELVEPLRFCAAQEKFNGVSDPLGQFVGSGKIHGPLPDDRIE
jgi:hypothetical protein